MAKFTWSGTAGFRLYDFNLSWLTAADSYERSPTTFKAVYGPLKRSWDKFDGYGFTYTSDGIPTGGTVTAYSGVDGGKTVAQLTGVNISVMRLVNAASTYSTRDDESLLKSALSGSDQITGGRYDDNLYGFNGNDVLTGGGGADWLTGGKGADRFVFRSVAESRGYNNDYITDFSRAQRDRIDLSKIDAKTGVKGNQAFKFIGTAEFSGSKGELRYDVFGGDAYIEADVNGDAVPDFELTLANVTTVTKSYFIL